MYHQVLLDIIFNLW